VLVVGLVWAGVPAQTLLVAALVLACPLMMLVMMRGMHGAGDHSNDQSHRDNDHDTVAHR
jgi:hypothetical protein